MDCKQFDELVARLASGTSRRNAVKGVVGGALATVGVTSVAAEKGGNGKAKGPKEGKGHKGGKGKVTICHRPKGNPTNCQTITIGSIAALKHLKKHADYTSATFSHFCDSVS